MNKEIAKKWVEALRSGEYKQGVSRLRIGDTYCCLGVLCDLYGKEKGVNWKIPELLPDSDVYQFLDSFSILPDEVAEWAETETVPGVVYSTERKTGRINLSELNDREKLNFKEIADLIENEYLK